LMRVAYAPMKYRDTLVNDSELVQSEKLIPPGAMHLAKVRPFLLSERQYLPRNIQKGLRYRYRTDSRRNN